MSGSEWSSECESGWTLYLDESSLSSFHYRAGTRNNVGRNQEQDYDDKEEEEQDMSMVSDASSGPPRAKQEEGYNRNYNENEGEICKKKKNNGNEKKSKKKSSCNLDDTASSPAFSYSQVYVSTSNNQALDYTQDLSDTHYKGNAAMNENMGFWQSRNSKKLDSAEPSRLRGRR